MGGEEGMGACAVWKGLSLGSTRDPVDDCRQPSPHHPCRSRPLDEGCMEAPGPKSESPGEEGEGWAPGSAHTSFLLTASGPGPSAVVQVTLIRMRGRSAEALYQVCAHRLGRPRLGSSTCFLSPPRPTGGPRVGTPGPAVRQWRSGRLLGDKAGREWLPWASTFLVGCSLGSEATIPR